VPDPTKETSLPSKLTGLLPLYLVYFFLAGSTFLGYYYRSFGLSTRTLDFSLTEVLMKSFVLVLDLNNLLVIIYLILFLLPLLAELSEKWKRSVPISLR
jgi:hypothetical protein